MAKVIGVPFKPGKGELRDPHINTAGGTPPDGFKEVREAVRLFLAESLPDNRTRLRKLLEDMARTRGERVKLLEYGWGKVPDKLDLSTGGLPLGEAVMAALELAWGDKQLEAAEPVELIDAEAVEVTDEHADKD